MTLSRFAKAVSLLLPFLAGGVEGQEPGSWMLGPGVCGDRHWRPPVSASSALPASGNLESSIVFVSEERAFYFWEAGAWVTTSAGAASGPAGGDLSGTYPNPSIAANAVALGTDTTGGYAASASEAGAATTALALAANGANCTAGAYPLGVDASGAVESCTTLPAFPNYAGSSSQGGAATTALALVANGANCSAGSYPLGVDASGAVETCTAIPSFPNYAGSASQGGPATTALALASDGTNCSGGQFATGVDASGAAQGCAAPPAGVTDHSALTGLTTGDPHTQYPLGAGRAGGQVFKGGTAAGEGLTLYGTAHSTKGPVTIVGSQLIMSSGTYNAMAPAYSFIGDTLTGLGMSGSGELRFSFQGTNSIRFVYNTIDIERDDGRIRFGGANDAGLKRTDTAQVTVTDGSGNPGTIRVKQGYLVPQASAPPCSANGLMYFNSSGAFCGCYSGSWIKLGGDPSGTC